ncbi:hypothetical protein [Dyadobacter fermentans]|uniref:Uncharacterized protein n=1 Tax=Dyadobacter fermentans (strain ATCC 700827 / DSM 18053 / CIP 107007 / KCTC 52180 / NS114) TaxID=471854 RepID=C6VRX8_DYAFD|nr:hypothetical protein [Dyadobacter fermentans]ACT94499.1 hypothetical protein Dfer_3287 [Dyadobacter fermentans DSM 18053]
MKPRAKSYMLDLSKVKINPNLKSHANDPFVVRKIEEAKRVLKSLKTPIDDIWD